MVKKTKETLSGIIASLVIIILIMIGGALTNPSPREEAKMAIFTMARNGLSEETIASSYKFREYPYNRIFKELQSSGELDKLIEKGWSSRWPSKNP